MGAWGPGVFENDCAGDWVDELEGSTDLSCVEEIFETIVEMGDDYIEVDEGSAAVAACEVVARLAGKPGEKDTDSGPVDEWVAANPQSPPPELVKTALAILERIRTEPSELLELWEEEGSGEWLAVIDDLRSRLAS